MTSSDPHDPVQSPVSRLHERLETELVSGPSDRLADQPQHRGGSDALAYALMALAGHYGQRTSYASLINGLPLMSGKVPLEYLDEVASRAGLHVAPPEIISKQIIAVQLPALLIGDDGDVTVLWGLSENAETNQRQDILAGLPDDPQHQIRIPLAELLASKTARLRSVRPSEGLDSRAAEAVAAPTAGWFLPAFRQCRPIYAQAILATLVINTLALAMPLFTMNVYDRVLPNAAEATLWALGFGVLLAIVLDFILRTLRAYFVDAASRSADVRLSNLIYARLLGAQTPKAIQSTGVRANTMREFETLREFFNSATLTAFGDLPFLLLFVAVIYYVAGPLAWLVLAAIPVVLFVAWLTQRALQRLIAVSFQQTAQKNAVVTETLAGLETIKVAGGESWAARKWEASVAEHVRTGLKIRQVTNLGQHTIQMIQTAVQVLIVFAGFYLIQAGEMTMGALIAATILSGRALAPLAQAATLLVRANQARIAYATLNEFVTAPQERRYTREAQTKHRPTDQGLSNNHVSQRKSGGGQLHCGMIVPSQWAGEINFEDVTFRYDDEAAPALDAVSLRIGPGERVGLLGPIGSGKSTALKLIHGIYRPDAGRVLIDQFAVSQLDPSELRSNVGLLLQGGDLFHGTLRENITMGAAGVDDTALIDAIKTAGAAGWIGRLPLGLDTLIRERGAGLSGGQRQSIALARACLGEPKILLLDEPTSDMDARTEATVLQRLKATLNNRTLLIVTHRPAPLELVDRLIVFDSGRVLHDGNKASVLKDLREQPATKSVRQTIHVGEKLKSLAKKRGEESHDA